MRETRKSLVEAPDSDTARDVWETAQETGDQGSFVSATTISYEMQEIDDTGNVIETFPAVQVE